jgi:8-oxo-dGTP diphosphatase
MTGLSHQADVIYSPQLVKNTLCFCHNNDEILLLLRNKQPNKNLWNGLGGKIEVGEDPHTSALREIKEESTLELPQLQHLGVVSWSYDKPDHTPYQMMGGMHIFWGEVDTTQRQAKAIHHQETDEGKLGWHTKEAIYNPESTEIVENIRVFLPQMIAAEQPTHHHFVYKDTNVFVDHIILSLKKV